MAGTVQQCVLVSTMRTRDGSRRNKPRKAWCRRSRGTKGLINASRVFVVATLNILHDHLYCHFVASFRLLQSPCHVLQCSTHYLRAAKDTETSNNLRFSTLPFFWQFVADAHAHQKQISVFLAPIDATTGVFIAKYSDRAFIMDWCWYYV